MRALPAVGDRGRAARALALVAATLLVLAACGEDPRPAGPAAEPAEAPAPERPPAGRVIDVGPAPEGLVVDAATGTVAVAVREPARLILLDARDGGLRAEVPLPGNLRHLALSAAGGPVLVPVEQTDQLVRVTLPEGQALEPIPTGVGPHDATAASNGEVFVADEFGGTVTVVDGRRVLATLDGPVQPGGIAAAGDRVGLVDVAASTLTVFDAGSYAAAAPVPAGDGPTHVVADNRGRFVVIDTRGDAVLLFEAGPAGGAPRMISATPLAGRPYGVAYDPTRDRLWVTLTERNELVGLDLASGAPVESVRVPTVRQPNTVAVDSDSGRVFVGGTADGTLQLFDPPAT